MGELPLSLHLDPKTMEGLEREARLQETSETEVVERAIKAYLEFREYDRRIMRERIAEAEEGVFISEETVHRWVESWGTESELSPPEPDVFPAKR
jgi:predicted transcriptional regulator